MHRFFAAKLPVEGAFCNTILKRGLAVMVKIDLITGFLGSGKTTFIK